MGRDFYDQALPALSMGGAAASGTFGYYGAKAQGRAIERASNIEANQISYETREQAKRIRISGRREIGAQRAALGASGLRAEGSPLELIAQNAAELERRAMETTLAGQYGASVARSRGEVARTTSRRIGAASLFEGATKTAYYGRTLY